MNSRTKEVSQRPFGSGEHEFAFNLMRLIKSHNSKEFSGIGVVFYTSLNNINMIDLGRKPNDTISLPIDKTNDICTTLTKVSEYSSTLHDGFHFLNVQTEKLTHLSQFISPQLNMMNDVSLDSRPAGAREMTAQLVSNTGGINGVGLLDKEKYFKYYYNGGLAFQS